MLGQELKTIQFPYIPTVRLSHSVWSNVKMLISVFLIDDFVDHMYKALRVVTTVNKFGDDIMLLSI